jgi:hypothetical protein
MINKKITLATVKAFAKKNKENLFIKETSRFDGMVDCVMPIDNPTTKKTTFSKNQKGNDKGINGAWFVGGDIVRPFEDQIYTGFEVGNCCGTFLVLTTK